MLIELLSENLKFPNKREVVPEIIQTIDRKLSLAGVFYSHFSINGVERYDELESFLLNNITGTEQIKIIGCTLKELADEVVLSAGDYLRRAVPVVTELVQNFYQEPNAKCWHQLGDLVEGVKWLLDSFYLLDRKITTNPHIPKYPNWDEYLQHIYSLKEIVEQLGQAMESKDIILIGDLLNYEVVELFNQMKESLDNMLPWEG